jgi:biotin-(acetyl-CoA carboxylase) ligase
MSVGVRRSALRLDLPPPFTLVTLREVGDAVAHAISIAAEQGAGTLVYVGRFDLAEFAVVLEPEEPLRSARRALCVGMTALTDALLAHAPPEKPIEIGWPDAITVDHGLVGGGRIAWPDGTKEDDVPAWLVFGASIRTVSMSDAEPGMTPLAAALEEEGFVDFGSDRLVESFARHLMVAIDAWQSDGFNAVAKDYLARLPREQGIRRDIDENGDLLVRRMGATVASSRAVRDATEKGLVDVERRLLLPLLATPSWYDPASRGPKTA